ncbi:hypothetical protein BH10PLA1_BH10PLA1_03370 [soil metagenome]
MNVVIAARKLPLYLGGLAKYQIELARALTQAGHAVKLVGLEGDCASATGHEMTSLSRLVRERPRLWPSMSSRPGLHRLLVTSIKRAYSPAIKQIVASKPDVIHYVGTGWDYVGFAMAEAAKRAEARFTIWPAVHPGQWGDDVIDLRLYRLADALFSQSDHERDHLATKGLDTRRVVRCGLPPMCLPDGDGKRLREKHQVGDRPVVLFMGRRDKGKGYFALLNAWPLVRRSFPDAILFLVGPPSEEADAPSAKQEGVIDLGAVSEAEKADALAACDVFCLPSAHESFGIVYVEAWSYGKPAICGTAPASRELVRDGETGLWADQDPPRLAEVIGRLLGDSTYRKQLGAAGLALQQREFTWPHVLALHLQAFSR